MWQDFKLYKNKNLTFFPPVLWNSVSEPHFKYYDLWMLRKFKLTHYRVYKTFWSEFISFRVDDDDVSVLYVISAVQSAKSRATRSLSPEGWGVTDKCQVFKFAIVKTKGAYNTNGIVLMSVQRSRRKTFDVVCYPNIKRSPPFPSAKTEFTTTLCSYVNLLGHSSATITLYRL